MNAPRVGVKIARLLLVSGFWPTRENSISGVFVVQQVSALIRAGVRVTVVVPTNVVRPYGGLCTPGELGLDESRLEFLASPSVYVPEQLVRLAGMPLANVMSCTLGLTRVLRKLGKSKCFDAAIVHGLRYAGLSVPRWRSLIRGRVVVVDHGVDPFFTQRSIARMRRCLEETAEAADALVLVGKPLIAHALSLGLPEPKLHVVSNGTELPRRETVSFNQRPTHECRQIVSVSNLVPLKGIDDNLRALAAVYENRPALKWEYRIVGEGPYRHELNRLALEFGLTHRVKFLGRLSYEATMREIAQADIFSLPSWAEAFGIVYLEAMARGRPAIGCTNNGAADIITDNEDGLLIMPRDVGALETAVTRLLESPELCSRLGIAGRRTAERFSSDENARRMLDLLDPGFVSRVSSMRT